MKSCACALLALIFDKEESGLLDCLFIVRLNSLNFVVSCFRAELLLFEQSPASFVSKILRFRGRALNGPLFEISLRILSSDDTISTYSLLRSLESKTGLAGTVSLD